MRGLEGRSVRSASVEATEIYTTQRLSGKHVGREGDAKAAQEEGE